MGRDILETGGSAKRGQKECLKRQEFVCVFRVFVTGFPVIISTVKWKGPDLNLTKLY